MTGNESDLSQGLLIEYPSINLDDINVLKNT